MTNLVYWQQVAADAAEYDQWVPIWPADLQRLVQHAVSLEERNRYLQAEVRRLERLALNNGS